LRDAIAEAFIGQGPSLADLPPAPKAKAADLVDRAVFVSVKLSRPGASKKIDSSRIRFNAPNNDAESAGDDDEFGDGVDRSMISVSKKLIDCPEYKAIKKLDDRFKIYIRSRCTPGLIRNGVFLLAVKLVDEVDKKTGEYRAKRKELIEAYGEVYGQRVKESLERLGPEGNPADYPPWEITRGAFGAQVQYITWGAPTVLGNVNQAIFEREQRKVAAQFENLLEMGRRDLRNIMADLVNNLAERLATEPGEEKKVFAKSTVDKFQDFLAVFDARNLSDDGELSALVQRCRGLLEGVDAKLLRKDDIVRKQVSDGLAQVKEVLGQLVIEEPGRVIQFDD
jgi:hypothetical protein